MRNWCVYQERAQEEVRRKTREYGIDEFEIEEVIANLISENYLNEERFVTAYCNGKLRIKHWGKYKIKLELRKLKVPEHMLSKALDQIDGDEYILILQKVVAKRVDTTKQNDSKKLFFDTLRYCISRGFEQELVDELLKKYLKIKL